VDACLACAGGAGCTRMQLWTNDVLAAARRIYLQRGFTMIAQEPHHSFGAGLVGQTGEADLTGTHAGHPSA